MKLTPSTATQFEILDPGVYAAIIDSVTPKAPNPKFEDSTPQLEFIFFVEGLPEDADDVKVYGWTGQTYGPKSKLRPWLAILMPDFDPEKDDLDTEDLVGKRCRIVVTVKKGNDGIERNRISELMPLETRRRSVSQAAPVKESVPF